MPFNLTLVEDFEQPSVSTGGDHAPQWEGLDGASGSIGSSGESYTMRKAALYIDMVKVVTRILIFCL